MVRRAGMVTATTPPLPLLVHNVDQPLPDMYGVLQRTVCRVYAVAGMSFVSSDFFFFQAEDGIRDWSVTGVQTCALPISRLCGKSDPQMSRAGPNRWTRASTKSLMVDLPRCASRRLRVENLR